MWFIKKKIPNKWDILIKEILVNSPFTIDHATDSRGCNWYYFNYKDIKYTIMSYSRLAPNTYYTFYNFKVYSDDKKSFIECGDFLKKRTLKKLYNHVLNLYNKQIINERMMLAEQQIFKQVSYENT